MASLLQAILHCLTGTETTDATFHDEKQALITPGQPRTAEEVADKVVQAIVNADKGGADLQHTLDDIVSEYGWTEKVAEWVMIKLEQVLREVAKLQGPLKEAYNKSCEAAMAMEGFVKEHPVFCTVIAIGVLVIITPWAIEALGFAELGPVEGTFAAAWQARYAGYVPKGSLFSFFQRLGMKWHL